MNAAPTGQAEPQSQGDALRSGLASIFANGFVLDLLRVVRGQRDVLDGVLLLCLAEANWPRQPSAPGGPRWSAPKPSSIGALANSLGMPFETVRRRTGRLCDDGFCEHGAGGLLITETSPLSPVRPEALHAVGARLRDLYFDLRRCGTLPDLQAAHPTVRAEGAGDKLLFHMASAYFLRMLEQLRPNVRSLLDGAILLAVYELNAAPLAAELCAADTDGRQAWPGPDRLRRPARVSDVAARLGLPYETIRRHTKLLVGARALIDQRRGLVVPRSALVHPATQQAMRYSYATLLRTFETCARLGILARWSEAEPAVR